MTDDSTYLDIHLIVFDNVHLNVIWLTDGWDSARYQEYASILYLSPADLKRLGIKSGAHVRLAAERGGGITVHVKSENRCSEGTGWLPASLYSNFLAVYDPAVCQAASPRVMKARISPIQDDVTSISQILQRAEDA